MVPESHRLSFLLSQEAILLVFESIENPRTFLSPFSHHVYHARTAQEIPIGTSLHFQTLKRGDADMVFRTAEYLAAGYFHNSQIISVDWDKRRLTFRHKSRVHPKTTEGEIVYPVAAIPVL